MIFGPRRRSGFAYGTKNRFLPMIINAPIDSIRTTYEDGWTKDKVHNNIVQQWNEWLGNHYILNEDDTKLHDQIQGLWEKFPAAAYLSTEFIQQTILKSSLDQKKTATILRKLAMVGLLSYVMKTPKRSRYWEINTTMEYPFPLDT